jgi:Protein of unknown function (DUF2442)
MNHSKKLIHWNSLIIEITNAKHISEYKIFVVFYNGHSGTVDLEAYLWGKTFEPLKDKNLSSQISVSTILKTITWPNDTDFAPEFILEKILEQNRSSRPKKNAAAI